MPQMSILKRLKCWWNRHQKNFGMISMVRRDGFISNWKLCFAIAAFLDKVRCHDEQLANRLCTLSLDDIGKVLSDEFGIDELSMTYPEMINAFLVWEPTSHG